MTRPHHKPLDEMGFKTERERIEEELARQLEGRADGERSYIAERVEKANKNGWGPTDAENIFRITVKAEIFERIAWELRQARLSREECERYEAEGL